jgi:di/tricarboxylate transporter
MNEEAARFRISRVAVTGGGNMTPQQGLSFAIIAGAVLMFAWGKLRYDLIAVGALVLGVITRDVPAKDAFSGFTSDVVVIIACALIISAAIAKSGVLEVIIRPVIGRLGTPQAQVPVLAGAAAVLSMLTKNVGALAILLPVALRVSRNTKTSPSSLLMPMSFMSLLGGLVTLVGTSTNIIVSQVREDTLGKPFQMFDFAPVGLVLTGLGLIVVSFGWRVLPRNRQGQESLDAVMASAGYATDAIVPDVLPAGFETIVDLKLGSDGIILAAVVVDGKRRTALPDTALTPGMVLVLEGEQDALDRLFTRTPLVAARAHRHVETTEATEENRSIEAIIQPGSQLIGETAARLSLKDKFGVNLLAVARADQRITERLRDIRFRAGDIMMLQAGEKALPDALRAMGALPLAERDVKLGLPTQRWTPLIVLIIAMLLVAFKILPVAIAFFAAAFAMVASKSISMREAYGALDAEVLVLIGALTPLSEAVRHSGGTDLIAQWLAASLVDAPALLALGALMLAALVCSPFLHNAPTVLVLGPIGVALASRLHLNPDAFLMAVATGAGCDFLTPIGHQCNTLVRGPGGYKFGDYARLGLPLSIMVICVGAPLIAHVWRLHG